MFDFFGTGKHRRKEELRQRRKEELRFAILDGQVRALLLVLGSVISLLPAEKHYVLIEMIKGQVGNGFTSDLPGLDDEAKQLYNDSSSMTLQNFIEVTQTDVVATQEED